jgi:hypothetical protein
MKNNTNFVKLAALSSLFIAGTALAQVPDTVRVYNSPPDTVRIKETQVIQQPAPTPPPPPPAPAPVDNDDDRAPLRKTEFGLRYFPTFSRLSFRTYDGQTVQGQVSMTHGYGVMLGHNFNRHVGLILEVNYNQISQRYKDRGLDRVVDIQYLNIPLMLSLNTDKTRIVNWNFHAGPQFGLNVGSSVRTEGGNNADTLKAVIAVKKGDVGLAYGTALEFALNPDHTFRIDVGFRGFFGLVDMSAKQTSNSPDTYNIMVRTARRTYSPFLGITFLF